jgi:catechol 2,3-dioxygenase-like lactoylglutathione lyase family enzyme
MPLLSKFCVEIAVLTACILPASAQLAAPNAAGVAMGEVHLTVKDVDANKNFFKLLGGVPVANGSLQMMAFPGLYVVLERGEPAGGAVGSVGSIVNHFGFQVKDMKEWLPKWQAAGVKIEPMNRPTQAYLLTSDDVRVEILEEPSLITPIAGHHIHFYPQDVPAMQAWYVKTFGAVAGKRAQFQTANLPGIELTFASSAEAPAPTKGRVLDKVGFEVKDLKGFVAKLEAAGIKMDRPYAKIPGTSIAVASFTDPWGTTIELTEGLAPKR